MYLFQSIKDSFLDQWAQFVDDRYVYTPPAPDQQMQEKYKWLPAGEMIIPGGGWLAAKPGNSPLNKQQTFKR